MELKEFIKNTVTQIADAVTELNGGTSKYKLTVNPITSITNGFSENDTIDVANDRCKITNIEFDLILATSEDKGHTAKVGVLANVVGIGISSDKNAKNESVNKIKFSKQSCSKKALRGNQIVYTC